MDVVYNPPLKNAEGRYVCGEPSIRTRFVTEHERFDSFENLPQQVAQRQEMLLNVAEVCVAYFSSVTENFAAQVLFDVYQMEQRWFLCVYHQLGELAYPFVSVSDGSSLFFRPEQKSIKLVATRGLAAGALEKLCDDVTKITGKEGELFSYDRDAVLNPADVSHMLVLRR